MAIFLIPLFGPTTVHLFDIQGGLEKIGHKEFPSNFEKERFLDVKNFTYATFDC